MLDKFTAIIVAGGMGIRFGGLKKQFLKLSGIPMLVRSADSIFKHPSIMQHIIVVPEEDIDFVRNDVIKPFFSDIDIEIVTGGETRQESVYNGLILTREDYVIIHDGVRPLVDAETVDNCIRMASGYGASVVCIPVNDTVKKVEEGFVIKTVDREEIYLAQTPQAFRKDILELAFEMAFKDNFTATDDAMILEYAIERGYLNRKEVEVKVVIGSPRNIKITFPEDILLAEFYINQIKK